VRGVRGELDQGLKGNAGGASRRIVLKRAGVATCVYTLPKRLCEATNCFGVWQPLKYLCNRMFRRLPHSRDIQNKVRENGVLGHFFFKYIDTF